MISRDTRRSFNCDRGTAAGASRGKGTRESRAGATRNCDRVDFDLQGASRKAGRE